MWSEPLYLWTYQVLFPHPLHFAEWCPCCSWHMTSHSHTQSLFALPRMVFLLLSIGLIISLPSASAGCLILGCNSPYSCPAFSIPLFSRVLITIWHTCHFTRFLSSSTAWNISSLKVGTFVWFIYIMYLVHRRHSINICWDEWMNVWILPCSCAWIVAGRKLLDWVWKSLYLDLLLRPCL